MLNSVPVDFDDASLGFSTKLAGCPFTSVEELVLVLTTISNAAFAGDNAQFSNRTRRTLPARTDEPTARHTSRQAATNLRMPIQAVA
jgi:hypothetical protein